MAKEKNETKRIAIYSRKSRFTGKGESIGNQVELCREYIQRNYPDEALDAVEIFEDEGFSGGNLARPGFQRMMDAVRAKQVKAIVVYRLDRISRNISDFASLIDELGRLGVDFVSIREQFDTNSPMGRAMMYIASIFSQLERETIAERIRDNMHELAKTGRWLGGVTPTGYTSEGVETVTVDGKRRKMYQLALIPEEAEIVRKIFDLYIQTDSLTMTETELLRQQVKTKTGTYFTRFAIRSILTNPVYVMADRAVYDYFQRREADVFSPLEAFDGSHGILAYNRTSQQKGHATVYQPVSEWIIAVGQHPGIIPSKTWLAVQASLERNKSKGYRKPHKNEALLTGLLYCSCGNRMYPKLTKRLTADGKPIYTYVCSLKEHSKRSLCNRRNANGIVLDQAVAEQVKLLSEDGSAFVEQLEKSRKFYLGDRSEYKSELARLQKQQADAEKTMDGLVDSLAGLAGTAAQNRVTRRIGELDGEIQAVSKRIAELEGLVSQNTLVEDEFDILRQLVSTFAATFDEMPLEQKRSAIRTVVRKVVWDGEYAHVILFGAPDPDDEITFPDIGGDDGGADGEPSDGEPGENRDAEEGPKAHRREDSKRDPDALPGPAQAPGGGLPGGHPGGGGGGGLPVSDGRHCGGRHHAGGSGYPGRLRQGAPVRRDVPGAPGAHRHRPALRPGRPAAPDPAGDRGEVWDQPLLCVPH